MSNDNTQNSATTFLEKLVREKPELFDGIPLFAKKAIIYAMESYSTQLEAENKELKEWKEEAVSKLSNYGKDVKYWARLVPEKDAEIERLRILLINITKAAKRPTLTSGDLDNIEKAKQLLGLEP